MLTDPGKDDNRKKQANKQISTLDNINKTKILNDRLTSQSITSSIINIARRLSSKAYQQTKVFVLETILRRRPRVRRRTLVDTDAEERQVLLKQQEEQVPTMLKREEQTAAPLVFSRSLSKKSQIPKPPESGPRKRGFWPPRLRPGPKDRT